VPGERLEAARRKRQAALTLYYAKSLAETREYAHRPIEESMKGGEESADRL
jgi:hypothetical protein